MRRLTLPALAVLFLAAAVSAQPGGAGKLSPKFAQLADVKVEMPAKVKRGETVTFKLTIELKPGRDAHTYPFFPKDPEQSAKNKLALSGEVLTLLPDGTDPPGVKEMQRDGAPAGVMDQYFSSSQTWEFKAQVSPDAKAGRHVVEFKGKCLQVCGRLDNGNDQCVIAFGETLPRLVFEVIDDGANPPTPAGGGNRGKTDAQPPAPGGPVVPSAPAATDGPKPHKPTDVYTAEMDDIRSKVVKEGSSEGGGASNPDSGLLAFVATAAAWGLISLVTPCVFPMIPITVSIFLKHAHGSFRERMKLAGVYCLTIIGVLGVSAFALLKFMAWLSAHPATNIVLGLLFLVLALSLFGMYEITLPNFIARRLQAKQAKGGVAGTVFGALAFTVVSFTCVAPFLGGFAGISAADSASGSLISMPTTREILGGLAFATAFAAPFFVLALVPSLLKALPKSGGWLDSVKVVMGFLELAAALKFFRTAEIRLVSPTELFTYDLVIAGWVGIAFACGLYLLNAYRLPHDEEKPSIGVPRLLFALVFLGLGFYLLPALFKDAHGKPQRPSGGVYAWVQAFLLPETEPWPTDLKEAIERSKKSGKPVLIDFTGVTCTNCKYNEEAVFPQSAVRGEFEKFERVQLYTDEVPAGAYISDPGKKDRTEEGETNGRFQQALFGDIALPMYVVLVPVTEPDGKVKYKLVNGTVKGVPNAPYEGKINSPGDFVAWLKESHAKGKAEFEKAKK